MNNQQIWRLLVFLCCLSIAGTAWAESVAASENGGFPIPSDAQWVSEAPTELEAILTRSLGENTTVYEFIDKIGQTDFVQLLEWTKGFPEVRFGRLEFRFTKPLETGPRETTLIDVIFYFTKEGMLKRILVRKWIGEEGEAEEMPLPPPHHE